MNALLWLPRGHQIQTTRVLRGDALRFISCIACNWPLLTFCPVCAQNEQPDALNMAKICPIIISDDGVYFHRHCLKNNILVGAVCTQNGVTSGLVLGDIPYPIVPQGPIQQGPVQQDHVEQRLVHQGPVPQVVGVLFSQVPNGVVLQFVAQSPLVGAPLMQMDAAGPSPQPQPDSTQEYDGILQDCLDFE